MKTFKEQAAQGDVFFRRIAKLPDEGLTLLEDKVCAHSETGHVHSFDPNASVWLYSTSDQLVSYLEVKAPAVLKHRRPHDTHEEILFDVGVFEIRRQKEYTPEGWRQVQD